MEEVIESFNTGDQKGIGLPLGDVTSQLLINVYMNVFDQFMKRELKVKYYIRYCDDFIVLHRNKSYLNTLIPKISEFLGSELKLSLRRMFKKLKETRTEETINSYLGLLKYGNTYKLVKRILDEQY